MVYDWSEQAKHGGASTLPYQDTQGQGPARVETGTWLNGRQYLVEALQERHRWTTEIEETTWMGQDVHAKRVVIMDVVILGNSSIKLEFVQAVTRALLQFDRSLYAPTLIACFAEQGHLFFVVNASFGSSLQVLMEQSGGRLPEKEVYRCCLHLTEALEHFWQREPPLIHGSIQPKSIMWNGERWILIHFSMIVVSGRFPSLALGSHTAYDAPELLQGQIRMPQHELYAVLASACHALTGVLPEQGIRAMLGARLQRIGVSERFAAILIQGLQPLAAQRFQTPTQLKVHLQPSEEKPAQESQEKSGVESTMSTSTRPATSLRASPEGKPNPSPPVIVREGTTSRPADETSVESLLPYKAHKFGDRWFPLVYALLLFSLFCFLAAFASY